MKNHLFIFAFATVFSVVSCQKAEKSDDPVGPVTPEETTIKAVRPTSMVASLTAKWEAGDKISVFNAPDKGTFTSNGAFSISEKNLSASIFSGKLASTLEASAYNWASVYPYKEANTSLSALKLEIGAKELPLETESVMKGETLPLIGYASNVAKSGAVSMNMKYISSAVALEITNGNGEEYNVEEVSITFPSEVAGSYTVDASNLDDIKFTASEANATIKFKSEEPVTIGAGDSYTFYAPIVPIALEVNDTIRYKINGKTSLYVVEETPMEFPAGSYATIYGKAPKLTKNLSAKGTANCYIVPQNCGPCKFLATRGCSSEIIEGIDSVAVLWRAQIKSANETDLTDRIIKNVSYEDGYIKFQAVNDWGNAVIAAYDVNKNILWSWHLWCNSSDPEDQIINGNTVLDRNIGAFKSKIYEAGDLSDKSGKYYQTIKCAGLLYQFGRKDPFTGRATNVNSTKTTVAIGTEGVARTIDTKGAVTIATATANPTVFYANSAGVWSTEEVSWDGAEKSIYDPCPVGYRVWDKSVIGTGIDESSFSTSSGPMKADGSKIGFGYYDANQIAFYPTTGWLKSSTGEFQYGIATGVTWFRNVDETKGSCLKVSHDTKSFTTNSASVVGQPKSYGFAVRCQKIQ